jgi:hypothetical protein
MVNENSLNNLTPFVKGISGNPGGKPKKAVELRKKILDEAEAIVDKLITQAKEGDTRASRILLSKGLPDLQSIQITDNRDDEDDNLSHLTEAQLNAIEQKEKEIEQIKAGGKGAGNESPEA